MVGWQVHAHVFWPSHFCVRVCAVTSGLVSVALMPFLSGSAPPPPFLPPSPSASPLTQIYVLICIRKIHFRQGADIIILPPYRFSKNATMKKKGFFPEKHHKENFTSPRGKGGKSSVAFFIYLFYLIILCIIYSFLPLCRVHRRVIMSQKK